MRIPVHLLAFEEPAKVRFVEVPDSDWFDPVTGEVVQTNLGQVFCLGQNDLQPQQCCSVSVGDVVDLTAQAKGLWLVCGVGFKQVSEDWLREYALTPRRDRCLKVYALQGDE